MTAWCYHPDTPTRELADPNCIIVLGAVNHKGICCFRYNDRIYAHEVARESPLVQYRPSPNVRCWEIIQGNDLYSIMAAMLEQPLIGSDITNMDDLWSRMWLRCCMLDFDDNLKGMQQITYNMLNAVKHLKS
jgi:hypothetical protein